MPELPEVETLRRSLKPLLGRTIVRTDLRRRDVVITPDDPPGGLSRARAAAPARQRRVRDEELLAGARLVQLLRRGKQLAIVAEDGRAIIVQLGMTGALTIGNPRRPPEPHTHILWSLDDGSTLAFIDPRRFGGVRTMPTVDDVHGLWSTLGPDALAVRAAHLHAALARTTRPLKSALLDQEVLAGVGNIYADESLFDARLHPSRPADSLAPAESAALAASIRSTLRRAIASGGSTLRDYRDANGAPGGFTSRHAVYARAGSPCRRCGRELLGATIAQRTTTWCPGCQPEISTRSPQTIVHAKPRLGRPASSRPTGSAAP